MANLVTGPSAQTPLPTATAGLSTHLLRLEDALDNIDYRRKAYDALRRLLQAQDDDGLAELLAALNDALAASIEAARRQLEAAQKGGAA